MEMMAVSLPATVTLVWELLRLMEKNSSLISTTSSSRMDTTRNTEEEGEGGMVSRAELTSLQKSEDSVGARRSEVDNIKLTPVLFEAKLCSQNVAT